METRAICIPNISAAERRKRLAAGLIQLLLSLAILAALISLDVDRWWRLALLPFFWGAAVGFFQWRDETWVGLAARGSRQLGAEVEKIEDPAELAQVRRQARAVQVKALLVAVPLTLIALALP
jgi:hypothetical protein